MRNLYSRPLVPITRLTVVALAALAIATPASAQFGGLKKKIKKTAGQEDQSRAEAAAPADPAARGGTVVLTEDVVRQLITGLKAGRAERQAAAKEDTPYGRYHKELAAYTEAQSKCEAEKKASMQKMVAKPELMDKVNALNEKMIAAQSKQDYKLMQIYQDSSMLLQGGPSCIVKKPEQPEGYYEAQREIDVRADAKAAQAAGLGIGDFALAQERAIMILRGEVSEGGPSAMERSAVNNSAELKKLLGFGAAPETAAKKDEPKPAPAGEPVPPSPQVSAQGSDMSACMTNNMQKNQAKIEALGKRAEAAQKAGDQAKMMAIADTLQQIQMAGCMGR